MPNTDARRKAAKKYREKQSEVRFLAPPKEAETIRTAAAASGESLAGFCRRVLLDYIQAQPEAGRSAEAVRPEEDAAEN